MQVMPDFRHMMRDFEGEYGFPFKGPGFYLSKTDTILVIPLPPDNAATAQNVWLTSQPKDTIYEVNVYNCPFEKTVFAAIGAAPVWHDERG